MAIAFVPGQNATVKGPNNPPGGTVNLTLPGASLPGNFYALWVANGPATSVTDNASPPNTYQLIYFDTTWQFGLYYSEDISVPISGDTTLTVTQTDGGQMILGIMEFSGVALTSALDQSAHADGSGSPLSSGNMTPSLNGELIVAAITNPGGFGFAPGPGFTNLNEQNGFAWCDEYEVLTGGAGTPVAATATFSVGGVTWGVIAATFKPAGATQASNAIFDSMDF